MSLHEVIAIEMGTLTLPLEDAIAWVREHVTVRPGFRAFAEEHEPVILSSGFKELIEPVLEREGVSLEVHANRLDTSTGNWRPIWRDDAQCAECGEACKRAALPDLAGRLRRRRLLGSVRCARRRPRLRARRARRLPRGKGRRLRALRGLRAARVRPRPLTAASVFGQMTKTSDLGARQRRSNARSQRPRFVLRLASGGPESAPGGVPLPRLPPRGHGRRGPGFPRRRRRRGRADPARDADAERRRRAAPLRLEPLQLGLSRSGPLASHPARLPFIADQRAQRRGRSAPASGREGDRARTSSSQRPATRVRTRSIACRATTSS